jgi:hypothetical protein
MIYKTFSQYKIALPEGWTKRLNFSDFSKFKSFILWNTCNAHFRTYIRNLCPSFTRSIDLNRDGSNLLNNKTFDYLITSRANENLKFLKLTHFFSYGARTPIIMPSILRKTWHGRIQMCWMDIKRYRKFSFV